MKLWSNSDIPAAGTQVPEKRLLAAVLQRAITDFVSGEGELRDGARTWLMDDDDNSDEEDEAPLTFAFVCEALDLDQDSLRRAIAQQAVIQSEPISHEAVL